jgi:hypothetical protein
MKGTTNNMLKVLRFDETKNTTHEIPRRIPKYKSIHLQNNLFFKNLQTKTFVKVNDYNKHYTD